MLEIGPGLGQVTEFLVDQCEQLYLIELESVCARFLEKKLSARYPTTRITGRKAIQLGEIPATTRIVIVEGDTLTIPFPKVTKVVSSVPYSICYELMLKFINTWQYQSIHLILQKEFIDHVLADVGENGYTVMAAFAGFYLNGERVLDIPNDAFFPEPDVQSLITKYTPKDTLSADAPKRPIGRNIWHSFEGSSIRHLALKAGRPNVPREKIENCSGLSTFNTGGRPIRGR